MHDGIRSSCSDFHMSTLTTAYALHDAPLTRFSNSAVSLSSSRFFPPPFHTARLLSDEGQQPSVAPGCARGIEPLVCVGAPSCNLGIALQNTRFFRNMRLPRLSNCRILLISIFATNKCRRFDTATSK